MNRQYQVTLFRAEYLQKLRNVKIHSPSIIQIVSGSKRLYWKDSAMDISLSKLLLCEASASLSFENLPAKGRFLSRMFTFHLTPESSMLELSQSSETTQSHPLVEADKALQETLNTLFSFHYLDISKETQTFLLKGLYQQLAERGVLHNLFINSNMAFSQKLSRYLSNTPSAEHKLETVANHFAISRATMIRRLKQEGNQYREVLADVRLNHALYLIQNGQRKISILAQSCGYQSEGRFSQRFKSKFGVTPSDYMKTILL